MRRRDFLALLPLLGLADAAPGRSCIVLRMNGGPSQLDTWDPKPDAPAEIRGPFRAIRTNVPGIEISEIFPRTARHADKYSIIRSIHHTQATHREAERLFHLPEHPRLTVVDCGDWDIHGWKPFGSFADYRNGTGPAFDLAFSSLLEGLSVRGLLESTLVVALGEFGRGPKINPDGGRDHWPHCFSAVMAGGGIRAGQIFGSSDRLGAEPRDNPVTPESIAACIHRALGIAPRETDPLPGLFA